MHFVRKLVGPHKVSDQRHVQGWSAFKTMGKLKTAAFFGVVFDVQVLLKIVASQIDPVVVVVVIREA